MDREAAVVRLDENHRYWIGARPIPGVTEVLESCGFYEFPFVSPEDLARAKRLGHDVHRAAELYDRGTLDWQTVTDEVGAYLQGWVKFRSDHPHMVIRAVEKRLFHPSLEYAGTLDRVLSFRPESPITLGDIKTGADLMASRLQSAAYFGAYNAGLKWGERAVNRCSIHLKGNGAYSIVLHEGPTDFVAFTACLRLYHWKKGIKA